MQNSCAVEILFDDCVLFVLWEMFVEHLMSNDFVKAYGIRVSPISSRELFGYGVKDMLEDYDT